MPNIEVVNSGDSSAPVALATGGTYYAVARIDGPSGKTHRLKMLELWIDNGANTDGPYEVYYARCATSNVDTEWGALTAQKTDSSAGAAVAAQVYKPSGGTPSPTSITGLHRFGGVSYASKFKGLFDLPINENESFIIYVMHPVSSRNCRYTMEIQTP